MHRITCLVFLIHFAFSPGSFSAGQPSPLEFETLEKSSPYIILGKIQSVRMMEESGFRAPTCDLSVEVISFLRGVPSVHSFVVSLRLSESKASDFDPKPGALAVFYLKALKGRYGTLADRSSVFPTLISPQPYYAYVARIGANSAILAWGKTHQDQNLIGIHSKPLGKSKVRIGGQTYSESSKNWIEISGLRADQEYPYQILLENQGIGKGSFRTYPEESDKLAFFVIGDWGYGSWGQYQLAKAMYELYLEKSASDNPIRFVMTTGDNIYADKRSSSRNITSSSPGSGDRDSHWEAKFFWPHREVLKHIPFYPCLGNHDGDESEKPEDLEVYLDNFFLPARYYSFRFARLAEFFSLDSTASSTPDGKMIYSKNGEQHQWLKGALEEAGRAQIPWIIPYFHHPPYTAGPRTRPSSRLSYLEELFERSGVKAVFNGHEHNFQFSEPTGSSRIRYIVTGGGGKTFSDADLRSRPDFRGQNVQPAIMKRARIAYWMDQFHFLHVEIQGDEMTVQVRGVNGELSLRNQEGEQVTRVPRITLAGGNDATARKTSPMPPWPIFCKIR